MDAFRRFKAPHTLKRYSIATVQLLCFVHLFNEHVAEIRMTTGRSMVPTLSSSTNLLLVESLTRTFTSLRPLRRGDIVTAINPVTKHPVCKRIVATEGQAVHTRVANLAQAALTRSIPVSADASSVLSDEPHWVSIPKGHVWLVGDNEDHSLDSRHYGPVPMALVRGRVIASLWPHPTRLDATSIQHKLLDLRDQ